MNLSDIIRNTRILVSVAQCVKITWKSFGLRDREYEANYS